MHIAQLEPPHAGAQGDHGYRTLQPLRALGELPGVTTASGTWLTPAMRAVCAHADLLVLCQVADPDLLPLLVRRRAAGLPTVYEINDDFTAIQPWNPTARFFAVEDNCALVHQLAARCNGLQFSSAELKRVFGHLGAPQAVFPNQLWALPPPRPAPTRGGRLWLGWAGSYGHLQDVQSIVPALRAAMARHPHLGLAIMGDVRLRSLFAWAAGERFRFCEPGDLAAYHDFVATLDVGLAPLRDTGFNRGRSDIKLLEYAAHDVAALCSMAPPYAEAIACGLALGFHGACELSAAIDRLVTDRGLRRALVARARAALSAGRLERMHAPRRLAFYRGLALGRGDPEGPARAAAFLAALRPWTAAFPGSRYVKVPLTVAGQHLYNGLQCQDAPDQARRDFAAAARAAARDYLPQLHLGRQLPDAQALAYLRRAVQREPASISARFVLALAHARCGDPAAATRTIADLLALCPEYAPARAWLGRRAQHAGDLAEAEAHYRRCLADNPFYRPARRALCALALDRGAVQEAAELLAPLLSAEPATGHDDYLFGRLQLLQGAPQAACQALRRAAAAGLAETALLPHLARATAACGDRAGARRLLDELRRLTTGDRTATHGDPP